MVVFHKCLSLQVLMMMTCKASPVRRKTKTKEKAGYRPSFCRHVGGIKSTFKETRTSEKVSTLMHPTILFPVFYEVSCFLNIEMACSASFCIFSNYISINANKINKFLMCYDEEKYSEIVMS